MERSSTNSKINFDKDKISGMIFMKIEEGLDVGPYMKQIEIKLDEKLLMKLV